MTNQCVDIPLSYQTFYFVFIFHAHVEQAWKNSVSLLTLDLTNPVLLRNVV